MVYRGRVHKGKIVLDDPSMLAEGTLVAVRPLKSKKPRPKASGPSTAKLKKLAAKHKPPQSWYDEDMEGLF
jgi:hypothetical protein